jgi:hypothetical protein
MNKGLIGLAALPFLANVASAGQPTLLSDVQIDRVTAGTQSQTSSFNPTAFQSQTLTSRAAPTPMAGVADEAQGYLHFRGGLLAGHRSFG